VVRSGPSDILELRRAVLDGYPAVVLIGLSPHILGRKHYLAVKGFDSAEGYLLADYGFKPDVVLRPGPFPGDWRAGGGWALYCWPPEKPPEWATAFEELRAGRLLEGRGEPGAAAAAYRRAAGKDARLWEAHFNLGNLELARRRFEPALAAYRRALEIRPDEPDIMNNLAWTLHEFRQEPEEAESLARRALKMSPPASAAAARAAHTLGAVLAWRGKAAEAREAFLRAIESAKAAGDEATAAEARAAMEKLR
jgi:tetratricopeptide (TPR) repeat protein